MHVVMHVQQLNLILFEGNVNYNLKVLKINKMVRLSRLVEARITLEFCCDIRKEKEKVKKNNDRRNSIGLFYL